MTANTYKRNIVRNKTVDIIPSDSETIRIAQWNIFAQGFVEADNYQYCTPSDLSLENRKILFRKEFMFINADIYCFQEADIHRVLYDLLNERSDKYSEIFASKSRSPCLLYPNNFGPDGCSIIYNKEKFDCLHNCVLNFEESGSYVCVFAVFCFQSNRNLKFIMACTHLKSKKSFANVRLMQCTDLLSKLHALMHEWKVTSVFICGDFNASPNEVVIEKMKESPLNFVNVYDEFKSLSDRESHFTTWSFRKDESQTKRISNHVNYAYLPAYHREYNDTIDYIWYTSFDSDMVLSKDDVGTIVVPVSILDVPDKDEIGMFGIPSPNKYPSDHISLIADFMISTCPPS